MKIYPTEKIRNLAVVGHSGSGKTSLTEAMLYTAGALNRLGRIDDGNTTSDFDPDEIKRKVSISTSVAPLEWQAHKINLLDTPGYADFIGEVIAALRAVNVALIVVDGIGGVQVQTEKAWQLAQDRGVPCLFFINRLDKEHTDFNKVVGELRDAFGKTVAPIQLPIGSESDFKGIADLIDKKAFLYKDGKPQPGDFPGELEAQAAEYREHLMEAVAESDDALLEKYLEGQELTHDEIAKGIKRAIANRSLAPILCGSAHKLIGLVELLNLIVEEVPSPAYIGAISGRKSVDDDTQVERRPETSEPVSALVFKSVADPYVGKLSYIRVFSGTLKADSQPLNATKGKKERIGHLYVMTGKHQEETAEIPAGDIGAAPKLADAQSGDTLCADGQSIVFNPIKLPNPLVAVAVFPKSKGDEEKLGSSLLRLTEEDPTLRFKRDVVTHEQVLSGVGDLHIEVTLDKLQRRFGVEAQTATPKIAYQETIKGKTKTQGKYKKQTGGRGQYGDVWIEIEPLSRGEHFEFVDKIVGGAIPRNFIPAVEKGVREAMEGGVLTHYPAVDIRLTLFDGSFHPVDSSEMAFKIAGSMAFKKAFNDAKPILLEPIYTLEVTVPEANMGDVMGDLSGKRGKILGMEPSGKVQIIKAQVPLAEIQRYSTELRSLTGGRGNYSQEFSHYEEIPPDQAHKIIEAAKKEEES